jgi:hypothetical protein
MTPPKLMFPRLRLWWSRTQSHRIGELRRKNRALKADLERSRDLNGHALVVIERLEKRLREVELLAGWLEGSEQA